MEIRSGGHMESIQAIEITPKVIKFLAPPPLGTKANSAACKLSLKLLIDTTEKKVLFAEAGKEVIDFLFSLLSLPVASVVKLLSKDRMVGSIGNLYKSIQELDDSYLQNVNGKSTLLDPIHSTSPSLLLPGPSYSSSSRMVYFRCVTTSSSSCLGYVSSTKGAICPGCRKIMSKEMIYVEGDEREDYVDPNAGFVKGVVTYTLMDDLTVAPMSSISSITLLCKFNVKNLDALVERDVILGFDEALEVLEISMQSKKVLTSVFLGKK